MDNDIKVAFTEALKAALKDHYWRELREEEFITLAWKSFEQHMERVEKSGHAEG